MEIYSKNGCKYCVKAKEFLKEKGIEFFETTLDPELETYDEQRQGLIERSGGHITFPWIWVGDTFIGGYTELIRAYDTFYLETLGIKVQRDDF